MDGGFQRGVFKPGTAEMSATTDSMPCMIDIGSFPTNSRHSVVGA